MTEEIKEGKLTITHPTGAKNIYAIPDFEKVRDNFKVQVDRLNQFIADLNMKIAAMQLSLTP